MKIKRSDFSEQESNQRPKKKHTTKSPQEKVVSELALNCFNLSRLDVNTYLQNGVKGGIFSSGTGMIYARTEGEAVLDGGRFTVAVITEDRLITHFKFAADYDKTFHYMDSESNKAVFCSRGIWDLGEICRMSHFVHPSHGIVPAKMIFDGIAWDYNTEDLEKIEDRLKTLISEWGLTEARYALITTRIEASSSIVQVSYMTNDAFLSVEHIEFSYTDDISMGMGNHYLISDSNLSELLQSLEIDYLLLPNEKIVKTPTDDIRNLNDQIVNWTPKSDPMLLLMLINEIRNLMHSHLLKDESLKLKCLFLLTKIDYLLRKAKYVGIDLSEFDELQVNTYLLFHQLADLAQIDSYADPSFDYSGYLNCGIKLDPDHQEQIAIFSPKALIHPMNNSFIPPSFILKCFQAGIEKAINSKVFLESGKIIWIKKESDEAKLIRRFASFDQFLLATKCVPTPCYKEIKYAYEKNLYANLWGLEGKISVPDFFFLDKEGFLADSMMSAFITIYQDLYTPSKLGDNIFTHDKTKQQVITTVERALQIFCSNGIGNAENIINWIDEGIPVLFASGCEDHITFILYYQNKFYMINRGFRTDNTRPGIYSFSLDLAAFKESLNDPVFTEKLTRTKPVSPTEFMHFFPSIDPESNEFVGELVDRLHLKFHSFEEKEDLSVGNCPFGNLMTAIYTLGRVTSSIDREELLIQYKAFSYNFRVESMSWALKCLDPNDDDFKEDFLKVYQKMRQKIHKHKERGLYAGASEDFKEIEKICSHYTNEAKKIISSDKLKSYTSSRLAAQRKKHESFKESI